MFDKVNVTVNATTTQYNISGLTPFVGYVVKIAATNVNGTGIFFEATQIFMQNGKYLYVHNYCKLLYVAAVCYILYLISKNLSLVTVYLNPLVL